MDAFTIGVGTTVAALFTLMIYSILFKENVLYRFAESTAIAVAVGYGVVTTLKSLRTSTYIPLTNGNMLVLIPLFLGVLTYLTFIKKYAWLSLWPIGFLTGVGLGLSVRGAIQAQLIEQIDATILPLTGSSTDLFNNIIIFISTIAVLYYFLFTINFKNPTVNSVSEGVRKFARYFIMVGLGVGFSGASLSWIVDVIVRIQFLLFEWLHL